MAEDNTGAGLRKSGPINSSAALSDGSIQDFPTMATPHPDTLNPTNDLGKHTVSNPPKNDLGSRGFGGA